MAAVWQCARGRASGALGHLETGKALRVLVLGMLSEFSG